MEDSKEKVRRLFGLLEHLDKPVLWPTGLTNMFEWLAWEPKHILGVSKNSYSKLIIEWSHEKSVQHKALKEKENHVKKKHNAECKKHEQSDRYAKQNNSIASVREAVRRAKYFSENYLNKEFDIFWALASDLYLDEFYGQFTELHGSGEWFTHGKNMVFEKSTGTEHIMHIDNLAYNPKERILVANELKLGGRKNKDQILKYAKMFDLLRERGFILRDTRFLLLFIGSKLEDSDWDTAINMECRYCEKKEKLQSLIKPGNIDIAKSAEYGTTTWNALMSFNNEYLKQLDSRTQQVEKKLLAGFIQTLSEKFDIQKESAAPA